MKKFALITLFALLASSLFAAGTIRFHSTISDGMVLQQNDNCVLKGTTTANTKITVTASFLAKPVKTKSNANGDWSVKIKTPAASLTPQTIAVSIPGYTATLSDVLIGDVWIISGQSNVEWSVRRTDDLKGDMEKEGNPYIRLFDTMHDISAKPLDDCIKAKRWHKAQGEEIGTFTAVGYAFGKYLQPEVNIPIGLINASKGGTPIECWMSAETVEYGPASYECGVSLKRMAAKKSKYASQVGHYYNANIAPLTDMRITGVVWYQGCSNASFYARGYKAELISLVESWRGAFKNNSMPFYVVEIAPCTYSGIMGAELRRSQALAVEELDHAELVGTMDCIYVYGDLHPRKKATIGKRLANCALGEHYGRKVVFRSPSYERQIIQGSEIKVDFKDVPTKLVAKGGRLIGFQIGYYEGTKLKYVLADARIDESGKSVIVSSPSVLQPAAVRYCFDESRGTLFSAEGLPVIQFRSDEEEKEYFASARAYIPEPSRTEVGFHTEIPSEFTKGTFTTGADWDVNHPELFEGFETMMPLRTSGRGPIAQLVAKENGYIYIVVQNCDQAWNLEYRRTGWKSLGCGARTLTTGKKVCYVYAHKVKAGQIVDLPRFKDALVVPLAYKFTEE